MLLAVAGMPDAQVAAQIHGTRLTKRGTLSADGDTLTGSCTVPTGWTPDVIELIQQKRLAGRIFPEPSSNGLSQKGVDILLAGAQELQEVHMLVSARL